MPGAAKRWGQLWNFEDQLLAKGVILRYTVEPPFNEPIYNEILGLTNDIFHSSNRVMYGKEPRYNEPISPVPWHFVKSRFYRTSTPGRGSFIL